MNIIIYSFFLLPLTSVMGNVHCTPVSGFPPEELGDINKHQYRVDKHGVADVADFFILQQWATGLAS